MQRPWLYTRTHINHTPTTVYLTVRPTPTRCSRVTGAVAKLSTSAVPRRLRGSLCGCFCLHLGFAIITQEGAVSGDGYDAEGSPHTVHETFVGLGLERAAEVRAVNGRCRRDCMSELSVDTKHGRLQCAVFTCLL